MATTQLRRVFCTSLSVAALAAGLPAAAQDTGSEQTAEQTQGSGNIGVNSAQFTGNILFAKAGNLFILHGNDASLTQLTQGGVDGDSRPSWTAA